MSGLVLALILSSTGPSALEAYLRGGGKVYLSAARTVGGVGGGPGVRLHLDEALSLQADASYLTQIGNVAELRAGLGWHLPGFWRPGAAVLLSTLIGDQLSFLTPDHPSPIDAPAFSLGVSLSPLRFSRGAATVSLLEVELGVGLDFPGVGLAVGLTLLETSFRF